MDCGRYNVGTIVALSSTHTSVLSRKITTTVMHTFFPHTHLLSEYNVASYYLQLVCQDIMVTQTNTENHKLHQTVCTFKPVLVQTVTTLLHSHPEQTQQYKMCVGSEESISLSFITSSKMNVLLFIKFFFNH